jgi:hypothetical protein
VLRQVEGQIVHYRHQLPTGWAPSSAPNYGITPSCTSL